MTSWVSGSLAASSPVKASLPLPDADTPPYVDLLGVTTIVLLAVALAL